MVNRSILPVATEMPVGFDDLVKTAGSRLSNDARLWQSEIISQASAAHPYLPVEDMVVSYNEISPVKGAAVGSIKVGSSIQIPIIVKRRSSGGDPELAPLDIFFSDGRYQPMTELNVKAAMQDREIGQPELGPPNKTTGGNPYIGDLTGDASPLEFPGQMGPSPNTGLSKQASSIPVSPFLSNLPDQAKGAIIGAVAFGGHRALRELEFANANASYKGGKASLKDKAKAIGKGLAVGGIVGGGTGAATTHLAGKMGLDNPVFRKRASVKEKILSKIRALPPEGKAALVGGIIGGAGAKLEGDNARGVVGSAATGAALSAGATHLRRKIASLKTGLCEKLVKTANTHPNDIANFRKVLATNPQILQGASSSNLRTVELILRHKGPGAQVPGVKITRPNTMIIYREPETMQMMIKFTGGPSERLTDSLSELLGESESKRAMADIKETGLYVCKNDLVNKTWSVSRNMNSNASPVERDGMYIISDRNGGFVTGSVAMQMIRPNGVTLPMKLFITSDGRYAVAEEMYGKRLSESMPLATSFPKKTDHGVFTTKIDGNLLATTPMVIESVQVLKAGKDQVVYNVRDPMNGEIMSLIPSETVQGFVRIGELANEQLMSLTRGDVYLIPRDVRWIKFTGRVEVAKSADQIVKVAEIVDEAKSTKVAFIHGGYHFEQGDESWRDLDKLAAIELLAGMGITKSADIVDVLIQAKELKGEQLSLNGLDSPVLETYSCKIAEDIQSPVTEMFCNQMKPTARFIKQAADTNNDQVLDVVLGLNFITPQNVRIFTDSIEQFDEAGSKLASLLLASRLGLKHIKEDAVKEAMEGISRTTEQLKVLQSANNYKRQKSLE